MFNGNNGFVFQSAGQALVSGPYVGRVISYRPAWRLRGEIAGQQPRCSGCPRQRRTSPRIHTHTKDLPHQVRVGHAIALDSERCHGSAVMGLAVEGSATGVTAARASHAFFPDHRVVPTRQPARRRSRHHNTRRSSAHRRRRSGSLRRRRRGPTDARKLR
jgi:hypothetical protein